MSSAIEKRECLKFHEIASPLGHLVPMNWNEFVIVPADHEQFSRIYKYNLTTDQWTPLMSTQSEITIPDAAFDPDTETLYMSVYKLEEYSNILQCHLKVIDTKQWTIKECLAFPKERTEMLTYGHLVLIGNEIHILYDDDDDGDICRHFVVHKVSGDVIQEPVEIHPDLCMANGANFVASRNSILLVGQSQQYGTIIVEYSLTTKQWEVWEWARAFLKEYFFSSSNLVSVMNGRHILSFGGCCNESFAEIDSIMIYDVEAKQCVESELKLPMKGDHWQAILMADQDRDEMLTFGFVKRCYKAEEFRTTTLLPTPLIAIVGEYFAMEFVYLILAKKKWGPHYRINVDDILNCQ